LCTSALQELSAQRRRSWFSQAYAPARCARTVAHLPRLEELVRRLLVKALGKGRVFIITNASEGWVETSCAEFFPGLRDLLPDVEVISARVHEDEHPGAPRKWKPLAFRAVRAVLRDDLVTNLLSIGDSVCELEACHALAAEFAQATVKTVKLCEQPTAWELCRQLELVAASFEAISASATDLAVSLCPKD
jgi:hypothetical protein